MTTLQAIRDRVAAIKGQVGFQTPPPPLSADEFGLLLQSFSLSARAYTSAQSKRGFATTFTTLSKPCWRPTAAEDRQPDRIWRYMKLSSGSETDLKAKGQISHVEQADAVASAAESAVAREDAERARVIKDVKHERLKRQGPNAVTHQRRKYTKAVRIVPCAPGAAHAEPRTDSLTCTTTSAACALQR